MEGLNIKLRVGNEIVMLSEEVGKRYEAVYSEQGGKRFTFLAAQASLSMYFMKMTQERDDDWAWVPDLLDSYRTKALFEYEEAREDDDHDTALLMMARLRFLTTLIRRISDSRRSLLFLNEADSWEVVIGGNRVLRELIQLMEESVKNFMRVHAQGNEVRSRMAAAQAFLAEGMLRINWDLKDWGLFAEWVDDYIFTETERYNQARFDDDRANATAMLARVRFATTLYRRINDPDRKAWLTLTSMQPGTMH
jgi:hypothetical protein